MNFGQYIFVQITRFLPKRKFERLVEKYNDEKKIQSFKSNQTSFSYLGCDAINGVLKPGQSIKYSFQDEAEGVCINGKIIKYTF